jgi:NAD(P)-dependent dehydrogenase (short-subunit alcohol dehydrogenase family)
MRLEDKVIIVTGSTTGIGKAIALRCVAEGARVVITGLEEDLGNAVMKEIPRGKGVLYIGDITAEGAAAEITDVTIRAFGRIDAVVNNAAAVVSSDIQTTDLPFLRKVIEVNTIAPYALIRSALPYLEKSGGCVLNIGSVNAYCGEPGLLAYSISKGALMTMTRNLGDSLNRTHGVRVNQINPGWVLTEREVERKRRHGLPDDWYRSLPDVYAPSGRIIKPEEIAAAAVYWLSDESGPISGQVVDLEQYPFIGRNPPKDPSNRELKT